MRYSLPLWFLAVCLYPLSGLAQEAEEAPPAESYNITETDRLTGEWGGLRTDWEDKGIEIGLTTVDVYMDDVHGGEDTNSTHELSAGYDLEITLDLGAMGLIEGGTLYAGAAGGWVEGDGGDNFMILPKLWYEQFFFDNKLRVRVGKFGIDADFETNAFANSGGEQFMNGALSNASNVPFPDAGWGIQFVATPCDWFYFGAGVVDAQGSASEVGAKTAFHGEDHTFSIYEFGFMPVFETGAGLLPGGYRFGMWYDPQPKEEFFNDLGGRLSTVPTKRDDVGFYLSFDQMVFKENPADDSDDQGLGLFCRYSFAHEEANEIEHFWSVGAQYQGLIPTRDDDVLGFGFAQGVISDDLHNLEGGYREAVYEVYYRMEIFPWFIISPDIQYIVNPGFSDDIDDALLAGVRFEIAF